tara:strand:+ start:5623 stop:6156 length:534 start_codon:yes stop_codon:yes gene_type:complete
MQKFRQVDEGLNWVFEARGKKAQIDRLKELAASNQTIVPLVRLGVGAEKADWNLPEGMPESTKIEDDIPEGMGDTTLTLEWRRIKQFTDPTANIKNLPTWKQEMNWMSILEGMHHKEAELLTYVKDGQLLKLYPKMEALLKDIGITEYSKPKKGYKFKDISKKMEEMKAKVDFSESK